MYFAEILRSTRSGDLDEDSAVRPQLVRIDLALAVSFLGESHVTLFMPDGHRYEIFRADWDRFVETDQTVLAPQKDGYYGGPEAP